MIAPWDGDRINLKIATWNLARVLPKQAARTAKIVGWLDRVDADVWVLTETHNSVSPGPGYSAVSTGYPDRPGEPASGGRRSGRGCPSNRSRRHGTRLARWPRSCSHRTALHWSST